MEAGQARRFYLLTHPRSASNLLVRISALQEQGNFVSRKLGGYFFIPSAWLSRDLKLWDKHVEEWTQDERNRMKQSHQTCFEELEQHVEKAEAEGKNVFVKEHSYFLSEPTGQTRFLFGDNSVTDRRGRCRLTICQKRRSRLNETVLPDEFLRTWLPTFLIRHPALAFPSYYRKVLDNHAENAFGMPEEQLRIIKTLHWTGTLYEWFTQQLNNSEAVSDGDVTWPLVLYAEDVTMEPQVIIRFCHIVAMDATKPKFEWTPASEKELAKLSGDHERRTLNASAGVMKA